MSSGIPKINELPVSQDFIPGDKIIISRDNKGYLIDYDNLYVQFEDISFQQEVINDSNQIKDLRQYSTDKFNELVRELTEKSIGRSTAHLIDLTTTTSEGTLSSASYREFITSTEEPFFGPNNLVIFDNAVVDKLNISLDGVTDTENTECDVDRIVYGEGTISIPRGTYRIRASISLSPEINLNLDQNTLDSYIKKKQQVWAYMSFVQLTNPERTILNGSGASTYNNVGQSITLNLNGYFYTDKTRQYGIKVHTLGKLYPGVVTGTYSQNNNDAAIDAKYLSISDLFNREQYNQSRIIIERISDTNTLNPLEDSPIGFRSQALITQPRIPLIYNAGWLQRINAQNTEAIPSPALTTITVLPFQYRDDVKSTVGDLRCFITEPKSFQGYVKIGDTVKVRSQQPNKQGILPEVFSRYDVRDSSFRILQPGWYGLVVDENKSIGSKYDTIFRVDINGVVSQREYISDPALFIQKCIAGSTPAPTTTARPIIRPPSTIITTPAPTVPFGELIVENGNTITYVIPQNGPQFVHALCIGGGEGGIFNFKDRDSTKGGTGGDLAYYNNIRVSPGDILILKSGIAGKGYVVDSKKKRIIPSSPSGGISEIYLRLKGTTTDILLARAAGGGTTGTIFDSRIKGGYGGKGGIGEEFKVSGKKYIGNGGGGGAGGYSGNGGDGGVGRSFKTLQSLIERYSTGTAKDSIEDGKIGKGGGGGGGSASFYSNNREISKVPPLLLADEFTNTSGSGGGTGAYGINPDGTAGKATLIPDIINNGGPGSQGQNKRYGAGGSISNTPKTDLTIHDGGPGVVRLIWGTGKSFPNNAK